MYSDQRKIYEIYNYPDISVFMKNAGKTELKVSMTFAQRNTQRFFLYQVYLEFDWQVCPLPVQYIM